MVGDCRTNSSSLHLCASMSVAAWQPQQGQNRTARARLQPLHSRQLSAAISTEECRELHFHQALNRLTLAR